MIQRIAGMAYPMTFFIASQGYRTVRAARSVHGELHAPCSYAYCCPECGEIWARAVVLGQDFQFLHMNCEVHPSRWLPALCVPGSLLIPMDDPFNESLPLDLWRREARLHIRHAEKLGELECTST